MDLSLGSWWLQENDGRLSGSYCAAWKDLQVLGCVWKFWREWVLAAAAVSVWDLGRVVAATTGNGYVRDWFLLG